MRNHELSFLWFLVNGLKQILVYLFNDDLKDPVIAFMMLVITRVVEEHATSRSPREIRSVHNSNR